MVKRFGAILWARVSTQDQADSGNSIPAQLKNARRHAQELGIPVLHEMSVAHSAFNDLDECPEFREMIRTAIEDTRVAWIIVDKENRFARAREVSVPYKAKLRRHGVQLRSADPSEPYIDPRTVGGIWATGTRELMAEAQSLAIREDTMRAMKQHVATRDPEEGYCYKNGGVAPYPWETYHVIRGKDRRGFPRNRALWRVNEEKAKVVRWIVVDLKIGQGLSNQEITNELNGLGPRNRVPIPSPRGGLWSVSTVNDMFREDRLLQLAGYAYWNRLDPYTEGKKYKDRQDWIVVENAHPAVITEEEARQARAAVAPHRGVNGNRANGSRWLLSGKNLVGEPMFVCARCGANVVAWTAGKNNRPRYACGSVPYRHGAGCVPAVGIDKATIEGHILKAIQEHYGQEVGAERLAQLINERLKHNNKPAPRQQELRAREADLRQEIKRLMGSIAKGVDPDLVAEEIRGRQDALRQVQEALAAVAATAPPSEVTAADVLALVESIRENMASEDNEALRRRIRVFVRQLVWHPDEQAVDIYWYDAPPVPPNGDGKKGTKKPAASPPGGVTTSIDCDGSANGVRLHSIMLLSASAERITGAGRRHYQRGGRNPGCPPPGHPTTPREAARAKGVTRQAILRALRTGRLEGVQDETGHWLISPEALAAYRPR